MQGKFNAGNDGTALFVSGAVLLVSMFAGVFMSVGFDWGRATCLPIALISVGLFLVTAFLLTRGSYSAEERGVMFKVGFSKKYYLYSFIRDVKVSTIFEDTRRSGKIPFIKIEIFRTNGTSVSYCDQIPTDRAENIEELLDYQKEHEFTELCEFIKNKVEKCQKKN